MKHWSSTRLMTHLEAHRRLAVENLKCCPLCGAVNAVQNKECFVCLWHGAFIHEPEAIEEGVVELLERCPELIDVMLEEPEPQPTLLGRVAAFFHSLFRKKLDMRI